MKNFDTNTTGEFGETLVVKLPIFGIDAKISKLWKELLNSHYHKSNGRYNNQGFELRDKISVLKHKKCKLLGHKLGVEIDEKTKGYCKVCGFLY